MKDTRDSIGSVRILQTRMRTLRVGTLLMLFTLASQFILGMANNLFGAFPDTSDVLRTLESGAPLLVAHMVLAFVQLALGVLVAIFSFRRPIPRKAAALGTGGISSIFLAFESGIEFVLSGFRNNLWSFSMALGFLAAIIFYGFLGQISSVRG